MKELRTCSFRPLQKWSWINSFLFSLGLVAFSVTGLAQKKAAENSAVFGLHISKEPTHLDPNKINASVASYVLGNLYRNIFTYDNDKGLVPELGESCSRPTSNVLVCKLKKNLKWSDGSALTSQDFIRTYLKMLKIESQSPRADLLFKIKNAKAIYQGEKRELGITAPNSLEIRFEFSEPDPEFEYNLASLQLSPTKEKLAAFSGPYLLKDWPRGEKIRLEKNLHFFRGNPSRPPVEIFFIEEDTVSLQLYQKNQLQFLRRLPTLFIATYRDKPEFHWIPVLRFDYYGFGEIFKDNELARKALATSLNYPELQKIFSSPGRPGCSSLPSQWTTSSRCYDYNLAQAKKDWKDSKLKQNNFQMLYSVLGGEDHRRATEWLQSQWQKIGANINPASRDNKVYLSEMKKNPPPLFRKGMTPDRPTCLAILETFSEGHPENYLRLKSSAYEKILTQISAATTETEKKTHCTEGVNFLMSHYLLIPTGSYDLAVLAKPSYKGWVLNQINQLDLADLSYQP